MYMRGDSKLNQRSNGFLCPMPYLYSTLNTTLQLVSSADAFEIYISFPASLISATVKKTLCASDDDTKKRRENASQVIETSAAFERAWSQMKELC